MNMQLAEREKQLEQLVTLFDAAKQGRGQIVLVAGEAGIGKTALVKQFRTLCDDHAAFLWGMCDDLYTPQALAPFYDIAFQLGGELANSLPDASNLRLIGHTLLTTLQGQPEPSIVVIEDIHWADEATLDLIHFLGRRIERLPLMVILTVRDNYTLQTQSLQAVLGNLPPATTTRVELKALSADAVRQLAESVSRNDGAEIYRLTGGNAFYVSEMLASTSDTLPRTVRDAVLARAARLSAVARHILDVVSIVPNHAEEWLIRAAVDAKAGALAELLRSDIITLDDGYFAFRHELARRAVAEALPVTAARELHRAIFGVLRQGQDVALARLVHHAGQGGIGEAVVELAPKAARQAAAVSAYREAAAHYATALRYKHLLADETHAQILEARAYVCYMGVDWGVALTTYSQALTLYHNLGNLEQVGDILARMSRLAWGMTRGREARRYALEAVRTVANLPPSASKALAYSTLAQWHLFYSNQRAGLCWGESALVLADSVGADEVALQVSTTIGTILTKNVDGTRGLSQIEASLQRALQSKSHDQAGRAYVNLAIVAVEMHQPQRALHYISAGMQYTEEHDLNTYQMYLYCIRGPALLRAGRWDEAEQASRLGWEWANRYDYINRPHLNCWMVLGCLAARRGDPEATTFAEHMMQSPPDFFDMPDEAGFIYLTRAEIAWYRGDFAACVAEARTLLGLIRNRPHAWYRGQALYWLWRCGEPVDSTMGIAEPYRLQIKGDWRGAAAAWGRLGCPYERAMALANGDEAALREAFDILDGLGADAALDYLRQKLRALGVESVPRRTRSTTRENPAGLTERQMDVLALLVEGLSNPEIAARLHISPKTVGHHVSAILTKLNVTSREDASLAARERQLLS